MKRVAITGIGLVTPLGVGTGETWDALIQGRSAVGPIGSYSVSSLRSQLGAEIQEFAPEKFVPNRKVIRMMTRTDQYALVAATLAIQDSQINIADHDTERAGLYVGSNKEVSDLMHMKDALLPARTGVEQADVGAFGENSGAIYPLFYVEGLQAAALFFISQAFGLRGINTYFAGAAESGAIAIGTAYRAIRRGEADFVVAGGFDDATSWWHMTKYDALGLMTGRNDLGAKACRPYDRQRTGTVMGEGGAFLLLEDLEAASKRGARIYAEVTGFGTGFDCYRLLTPHPEGRGLQFAIQSALREGGSSPDQVGYVASDGAGTRLGDSSEARALRAVWGAGADRLAASSVKPATGNLIAGAGALNVAVAALALQRHAAPPTLNLENPDPACKLDWIPNEAREIRATQSIAVARGLTGQNVALALRAA